MPPETQIVSSWTPVLNWMLSRNANKADFRLTEKHSASEAQVAAGRSRKKEASCSYMAALCIPIANDRRYFIYAEQEL